jgi:ribosomal protein L11 methyltransferase
MAFGTGEHETTSMCITLLEEYITAGTTVLDIGTGSGVLGIASIKLGAKKAVMTDIDQVAVLSAKHNAEINSVSDNCEVWRSDLLDGVGDLGDLAVANITAEILVRLTNDISKQLQKDGFLIMSGIIKSRLQFVIDEFSKVGFELIKTVEKGEWFAVVMKNIGL